MVFTGSSLLHAQAPDIDSLRRDHPWIPGGTILVDEAGGSVLRDNTSFPFVPDAQVPGDWVVVDLVLDSYAFRPNQQIWQENTFALVSASFDAAGKVTLTLAAGRRVDSWTHGHVLHDGPRATDSPYTLVAMDDELYMFLAWKTEDYSVRYQKPPFMVLRKL